MSCFRHGHAQGGKTTREYKTWQSMMQRCYKTYSQQYDHYGARGIRVCERWHQFENFIADMGKKPEGLTLERDDTNLDYSPSNCRWATTAEQNRNKRDTKKITYRGKTQSMAEWSRELGINEITLGARLGRYGMSIEEALSPAPKNRRFITYNGVTNTLSEWGRRLGLNRHTLAKRLNEGMSVAEAFSA